MSSPAQVFANRQNAQSSTGPSTPAGKAASSSNATRHGLSATRFALMPNEDPAVFEELASTLRDEFQPGSGHEDFLVDRMIQERWKIFRVQRLEAEAFQRVFTSAGPADGRMLDALTAPGNILEKLQRYLGAAQRAYDKALSELRRGRALDENTQAKAVDNYIKQCVFAPLPKTPNSRPETPQQNEAKPAVHVTANAYGLGNPALRL